MRLVSNIRLYKIGEGGESDLIGGRVGDTGGIKIEEAWKHLCYGGGRVRRETGGGEGSLVSTGLPRARLIYGRAV